MNIFKVYRNAKETLLKYEALLEELEQNNRYNEQRVENRNKIINIQQETIRGLQKDILALKRLQK